MIFAEAGRLLDPAPLPLEVGWERLPDGVLHVAVRTDMHACNGKMFDWWFGSRPDDRAYRWWHPLDHVSSSWAGGKAGAAVGATHLVVERFTDYPADTLSIEFRDPAEALDAAAIAAARATGAVSSLLLAHGGAGHDAPRTSAGAVIGSRLLHVARDTAWGMVLRSHFFLGHDLPGVAHLPPHVLAEIFPDALAPNLLQHCYDEFTFLSRLLPGLYAAEGGEVPPRPW